MVFLVEDFVDVHHIGLISIAAIRICKRGFKVAFKNCFLDFDMTFGQEYSLENLTSGFSDQH